MSVGVTPAKRQPQKRNKFSAEKTTRDGITFDSKREASRYAELKLLVRAGEIKDLELQPEFDLQGQFGPLVSDAGRGLKYRADFAYTDARTGKRVIEDAKGFSTATYKLKKAIIRAMGHEIVEV